ncbi:MAG TPA: chaperone modulator CbpM [Steroidobacteraceae bacterium]|jgi:chaperone modulatory protein CbpM|nr:chaperone modulator CbpM [Steroidobacteraceae bacterium]
MTSVERTIETQVLAEGEWLSVTQVCRASQLDAAVVIELAELGLVCPRGSEPQEWQLPARELSRLRTAARLIRDLGVNVSGAALAVELLEARRELEVRLRALERCVQLSTRIDPERSP